MKNNWENLYSIIWSMSFFIVTHPTIDDVKLCCVTMENCIFTMVSCVVRTNCVTIENYVSMTSDKLCVDDKLCCVSVTSCVVIVNCVLWVVMTDDWWQVVSCYDDKLCCDEWWQVLLRGKVVFWWQIVLWYDDNTVIQSSCKFWHDDKLC